MSGFPRARTVTEGYRSRPTDDPVVWAAVCLAVAAVPLLVLAWTLAYGPALGSTMGQLCASSEIPPGFAPESPRHTETTLWPLGTSCEFGKDTPSSVVVPEESWAATIPGVAGSAFLVAAAGAGVMAARRRAR
ncbi:hypothetical protein C8046_16790 [Serinibacter arcticus]|uniref:Uncharacterized protein n=1 Tax=Serinibacter arcticus TaxID=1655435 RepID=A0A2U1ZYI5_9MICO|nr:hypothetical protein [Serinibacter arcticus]PWD52055.1 hypothetical protein C8046_16790 [Serinibacter arcticus]